MACSVPGSTAISLLGHCLLGRSLCFGGSKQHKWSLLVPNSAHHLATRAFSSLLFASAVPLQTVLLQSWEQHGSCRAKLTGGCAVEILDQCLDGHLYMRPEQLNSVPVRVSTAGMTAFFHSGVGSAGQLSGHAAVQMLCHAH